MKKNDLIWIMVFALLVLPMLVFAVITTFTDNSPDASGASITDRNWSNRTFNVAIDEASCFGIWTNHTGKNVNLTGDNHCLWDNQSLRFMIRADKDLNDSSRYNSTRNAGALTSVSLDGSNTKWTNSVFCDGTADKGWAYADAPKWEFPNNQFTVIAWVNVAAFGNPRPIWSKGAGAAAHWVGAYNTGAAGFAMQVGGNVNRVDNTRFTGQVGQWYCVGWVFNGSATDDIDEGRIYVDGENYTIVSSGNMPDTWTEDTGVVEMCFDTEETVGFSGRFDNFRLYDTAWGRDEINASCNMDFDKYYVNLSVNNRSPEFQHFATAGFINDTSGNVKTTDKSTFTFGDAPSDTTKPLGNASVNNTAPKINDIINITVNASDETGLSTINITINMTAGTAYFNYSVSGTSATIYNATTITNGRGNVWNITAWITDTSNNVFQNSTKITIADTLGTIQIGFNMTSLKINDVLNISGNITDLDGNIAYGWVVDNRTGTNINYSFTGSGSNFNFSQAITINVSRGNVINFSVFYNDTYNTLAQNSTLYTIQNTNPTSPEISNTSNKHYNTNITINITPSTDADSDALTYFWFRNITGDPFPNNVQKGTATSYTTNETSDGGYFYFVNVSDGVINITGALWNWTLDTSIPTFTNNNLTNNTFNNKNLTIFFTCNDNDIFNATGNLSNAIETFQFKYNDTPFSDNTKLNIILALNLTGLKDGNYTYTESCGDTHSEPIDQTKTSKGKKGEAEIIFNDTKLNKEINFKVFFREKLNKLTDTPADLKSYMDYLPNGFLGFGVNFTVVKPETKIAFNISTNQGDIKIINSTYEGHLNSPPYGIDFNGTLLVNGIEKEYTTTTTRISVNEVEVLIIPATLLAGNDVVVFQSKTLFGLNEPSQDFNIVVDNTAPTPIVFNISGILNNSFSNKQLHNITINATDTYSLNATLFLNDVRNSSVFFQSGINTNLTVNISTDGNYTLKIRLNDTAGNEVNFSYFQSIVIDTEPPSVTQILNRTTANSTSITTETDVNLTFFGGEIYWLAKNISHNATGSWVNYTATCDSTGNGTCWLKINKENLSVNEKVDWQIWAFDLALNNFGESPPPVHTFSVGSPPSAPSSPSGGGGGSVTIPQTLLNPFGTEPANGQCSEKQQLFDGRCYDCDSKTGYLQFNPNDRSVQCVTCNEGFILNEDKKCELLPPANYGQKLNLYIDKLAENISKAFKTENLLVGYAIIFLSLIGMGYYGIQWLSKK